MDTVVAVLCLCLVKAYFSNGGHDGPTKHPKQNNWAAWAWAPIDPSHHQTVKSQRWLSQRAHPRSHDRVGGERRGEGSALNRMSSTFLRRRGLCGSLTEEAHFVAIFRNLTHIAVATGRISCLEERNVTAFMPGRTSFDQRRNKYRCKCRVVAHVGVRIPETDGAVRLRRRIRTTLVGAPRPSVQSEL